MTCREFADFLADYRSGDLPLAARQRFDEHLNVCPNCRRYLRSYEETVKLGRRAFDDANAVLPAEVPDELVWSILDARRRS